MVDPFAGRSEVSAEEWLDVVGVNNPPTISVAAQDVDSASTMSPTASQPKRRATARTIDLRRIRENAWRDSVVAYARHHDWLCYFTWNSKHSPAGFPDLFMVRTDERGASRLVAAELKVKPRKITPEQRKWLSALSATNVETHVWTLDPADPDRVWREIKEVLRR